MPDGSESDKGTKAQKKRKNKYRLVFSMGLDVGLVNEYWMDMFPEGHVEDLTRVGSDHCPLRMDARSFSLATGFRFTFSRINILPMLGPAYISNSYYFLFPLAERKYASSLVLPMATSPKDALWLRARLMNFSSYSGTPYYIAIAFSIHSLLPFSTPFQSSAFSTLRGVKG